MPAGILTFHRQVSVKRSTVFKNYKMSICDQFTCKNFDIRDAHRKFSKKIEFRFTILKFVLQYCRKSYETKNLQIATKEKFWESNFREHQNFFSFSFTNKLRLPIWIFDVVYYFEWLEIKCLIYYNLLDIKNIMWEKI